MTKPETITTGIIALRNQLQPKFNDGINMAVYDYSFLTAVESFVKKERETAKDRMLSLVPNPDKEGILLQTSSYVVTLEKSKPITSFDKDAFIATVAEVFNIDKHELVQIATASVKEGSPRKTYKVTEA